MSASSRPETLGNAAVDDPPNSSVLDDDWLENFYKECGREVTLAYSTLNQMKNWAMIVAAAAISGIAFSSTAQQTPYPNVPMFVGAVIVYVFILRFYVRAILCYTNLLKWNKLQNDCLRLKLFSGTNGDSKTRLEKQLRTDIENHYFKFLPTVDRKTQLLSNLKLGFYPLFTLALFFVIWGAIRLHTNSLVRGLTVFAIVNTLLEAYDYLTSGYFDDVEAAGRRARKGKALSIFPVPRSRTAFFFGWVANLLITISVASWPSWWLWLLHIFTA